MKKQIIDLKKNSEIIILGKITSFTDKLLKCSGRLSQNIFLL